MGRGAGVGGSSPPPPPPPPHKGREKEGKEGEIDREWYCGEGGKRVIFCAACAVQVVSKDHLRVLDEITQYLSDIQKTHLNR